MRMTASDSSYFGFFFGLSASSSPNKPMSPSFPLRSEMRCHVTENSADWATFSSCGFAMSGSPANSGCSLSSSHVSGIFALSVVFLVFSAIIGSYPWKRMILKSPIRGKRGFLAARIGDAARKRRVRP